MTLTDTAALTKKVFIVGSILLLLSIIGWLGFQYYYYNIYLPSLPPTVEKPEIKFGPLPKLKLPQNTLSSSNYSYTLDTETGDVPKVPAIVKVYPITPLGTDLLALDRARSLADRLDFKEGPEMLSSTQYRFSDKNGGQFIINLDTGNFNYIHNLASESASLVNDKELIDENRLVSDFRSFLGSKNLLKDQLQNGHAKTVYEKQSKTESNFVTISLWQEDVDKLPIITSTFNYGLIKVLVNKSKDDLYKYQSLDYTFWPIDYENSSTYPIIDSKEAFSALKSGDAAVLVEPQNPNVSLTKVYLGYFLSEEYLDYLQPVYVFEGSQFIALIPAISPEFIKK